MHIFVEFCIGTVNNKLALSWNQTTVINLHSSEISLPIAGHVNLHIFTLFSVRHRSHPADSRHCCSLTHNLNDISESHLIWNDTDKPSYGNAIVTEVKIKPPSTHFIQYSVWLSLDSKKCVIRTPPSFDPRKTPLTPTVRPRYHSRWRLLLVLW